MVNIDCHYLTRQFSQKMRFTFLLKAPLGIYEFDLVNSKQKLQMMKLGRKKNITAIWDACRPSRTRCWFKGKPLNFLMGRTQVFSFLEKKRLDKSQNIKKNGFLWRMSDGKKCWLAFMLFLMLHTFLNAGRKEKILNRISFFGDR